MIEAIPRATQVLLDSDLEGADYLLLADQDIDARSLELEERCYQVLALQAPVASDLRQVMAAVKMISEIERSGDLCVNICKAARRIYGVELDPRLRGLITRMGEQAQQLFKFSIDAYVEADAPLAAAVPDMDDMLDRLHAEFIEQIFESHAESRCRCRSPCSWRWWAGSTSGSATTPSTSRARVRYMVTGWMPNHEGAVKLRSHLAEPGRLRRPPSDPRRRRRRRRHRGPGGRPRGRSGARCGGWDG